jgi:radical SAM superfamily enzyme YgiQ (UPF0313 family)
MSNLGFQSLYHRLSLFHGLQVHRYFTERDGTLYSPDRTAKTDNVLQAYDAAFFSVSFELDYIHILSMLKSSGIEMEREKRMNRDPLIIVGGVAVTANPAVMGTVADIVFIGDMDCGLDDLLSLLLEHDFNFGSSVQEKLSHIRGAYVPSIHGQVKQGKMPLQKATLKSIRDPAHTVVLTGNTEFSNMFLIEIGRGCRNSCGFCMTRCVHRPLRSVPYEVVLEKSETAAGLTRRVGLIAPVLTDHEDLETIVKKLNDMNMTVSFSSLRADDFNDTIAELLKRNGQSTVTFAPETGSEELRKRIGKNLKDDALLQAVSVALEYGIRRIRYYFIIGLPGETSHDMENLVKLVKRTVHAFPRRGARLVLSVNPFVPKMGTAMQHHQLYSLDYYNAVRSYILGELNQIKEVSIRFESLKKLSVHYYLSIGDHRIGKLLAESLEAGSMREFSVDAAAVMGF